MLRGDASKNQLTVALGLTAAVGTGAAALVLLGNPGNMGICGACFLRDTAGALGLFDGKPRIFRPEVVAVILGALLLAVARGRFEARSGSHAATRFTMGLLMAFGSLVFLGCPFRMLQRIGGGDLNAVVALIGFIPGVGLGLFFETKGYRVGRTNVVSPAVGLLGPLVFVGILAMFLVGGVLIGPGPGETSGPPHAPWLTALLIAGAAGAILSLTGFCAISAARQIFQKRKRMLVAAVCLIAAYAIVLAVAGRFSLSFEGQPAAHGDHLWSILAMALVGLTGALAGGCPVRQIVMTGEGNGDAFVTVAGILIGGALAHSLGIASSGAGTTSAGHTAVIVGLIVAIGYGAFYTFGPRPDDT